MQLPPSISPYFLWTPHLVCPYRPAHKAACTSLTSASPWGDASLYPCHRCYDRWSLSYPPDVPSQSWAPEVGKWSRPSSVPLLITQVPKQLCQHPESHQVAPTTPGVPPHPPPHLGNLEEPGHQEGPPCLPGFPHSQPIEPHDKSTELKLNRTSHMISPFSFLHFLLPKNPLCSSSYKAKIPRYWCVWEREIDSAIYISSQ